MADIAPSSTTGTKEYGLMDIWNTLAPAAAAKAASSILGNRPAGADGSYLGKVGTVGVEVGLPDWVKYAALAGIGLAVYFLVRK